MTLDNVNDDNILDSAPDAFHAAWSSDSRTVAVSFRSERHIVTLNIYAIDGNRAKLRRRAGPVPRRHQPHRRSRQ